MLTARMRVHYENDWTAELGAYDVFGEFLASTFRNRRYIGLITLDAASLDEVLSLIEGHHTITSVDVVERYESDHREWTSATLFIKGELSEFTPLQTLLYEGFLPIRPTELEDGCECFDLLLNDRDELTKAVCMLEKFGNVTVDRISQDFRHEITPSAAEWQELLSSIPPRQLELLNIAVDEGYFEIPREATLEELAGKMDITKGTASNHLRRAEQQLIKFLIQYINLASNS